MHLRANSPHFKTWIEVSSSSLLHNLREFRSLVGSKTKIGCVVKANAYGHGISQVVNVLSDKADWFCVDNIDEGLIVRALTKKPVLILGYIPFSRIGEAVKKDLSMVVYNQESIFQ